MIEIGDIIKTTRVAKKNYIVVGFDNPLPDMGGVASIIIKPANGKGKYRRVKMSRLYAIDGTMIKIKG
ncbi:MAG: hypothetical protein PHI02_04460 [Sulfurovaceae bacterium]|nr:hypothetical protein [Sulfurovaceae bacterium]